MSTKTNWYIVTGGPCSGKTKTIEHLSSLGYATVAETARILIDDKKQKGETIEEIRSNDSQFQKEVLQKKIDIEEKISPKQITFFDRGIPDSVVYFQLYDEDITPIIKASQKRRYREIFLLEQLPFEKDYARTENKELAHKINQMLYKAYSDLNYSPIIVPIKSIQERVDFILSRI